MKNLKEKNVVCNQAVRSISIPSVRVYNLSLLNVKSQICANYESWLMRTMCVIYLRSTDFNVISNEFITISYIH